MNAKVKATGKDLEVIEVPAYAVENPIFLMRYFVDFANNVYKETELEFPSEKSNELTIEGWVAVNEAYGGGAFLHTKKPHAESVEFCDTGDYEVAWRSEGKVYAIDRELFPDMNEESEPLKIRLTLTLSKE